MPLPGFGGLVSDDVVNAVVLPRHRLAEADAITAVGLARNGFGELSGGAPCEVVLLAVPAGKAEPFVAFLADVIDGRSSPGGVVLP